MRQSTIERSSRPVSSHCSSSRGPIRNRRPRLEALEDRSVPTAGITYGSFFDLFGGLAITGSAENDIAEVRIDDGGTEDGADDLVVITLNGETSFFERAAIDIIFFDGQAGNDLFDNDTDILCAASGGLGNDLLRGGSSIDILLGGGGNDELHGCAGSDLLLGDWGSDTLFGEAGNDLLFGGRDWAFDMLVGGEGRDLLVLEIDWFGPRDWGADFRWGEDTVGLTWDNVFVAVSDQGFLAGTDRGFVAVWEGAALAVWDGEVHWREW